MQHESGTRRLPWRDSENVRNDPSRSSGGDAVAEQLPYRKRDDFLSAAELAFFKVLKPAVESQFHVCSKVRISDLLYVSNRSKNMGHANRIDRKHVDFVLCDLSSMEAVLAIELDDSSHKRAKRKARDELVDSAFEAAGLPILHVLWQRSYSRDDLNNQIREKLQSGNGSVDRKVATDVPQASSPTTAIGGASETQSKTPPHCPKCQIEMVERRASRGKHKGKRFWACPSYPDCKKVIAID